MRAYLRKRRAEEPERTILDRARKRAKAFGLPFSIEQKHIAIPTVCPVLSIPIEVGGGRSAHSPSLDRINPTLGYVPGNVRVISDRANRLKGNRTASHLRRLASQAGGDLSSDYLRIALYVERETLLQSARVMATELNKLLPVLEQTFAGVSDVDYDIPTM